MNNKEKSKERERKKEEDALSLLSKRVGRERSLPATDGAPRNSTVLRRGWHSSPPVSWLLQTCSPSLELLWPCREGPWGCGDREHA